MDIVVEVVIGLKATNQHVSIPIRVQTRSISAADAQGDDDVDDNSTSGHWLVLSWLHIFLLCFLTCVLLVAGM